jgi:hypothetical protein
MAHQFQQQVPLLLGQGCCRARLPSGGLQSRAEVRQTLVVVGGAGVRVTVGPWLVSAKVARGS